MIDNIKQIAILGCTGSIGTQTLDIITEYPHKFRASVLSAHSRWEQLAQQALHHKPDAVVITDVQYLNSLRAALKDTDIAVYGGYEPLCDLVAEADIDIVVAAMVGYSGLESTLSAAKAGKVIALANKETLVAAGKLVTETCHINGASIIPVDSEHSAIFQCLAGENEDTLSKIILTASGGPFRNYSKERLKNVSAADALRHPNWAMGHKVTVDSATMMNKGFEMIEAHWLFNCPSSKIEIAVHPQSIVHSMVEFIDGSIKAQLGVPDMHLPIRYALGYPQRLSSRRQCLDLSMMQTLTFSKPDFELFPMLGLAFRAIDKGGTMPAAMAAADEVAVDAFLKEKIRFTDMPSLVNDVMEKTPFSPHPDYSDIIKADEDARKIAREFLDKHFSI